MEINGIGNIAIPARSNADSAQGNSNTVFPASGSGSSAPTSDTVTSQSVSSASDAAKAQSDPKELKSAVDKVKQFVSSATNELQFTVDRDLGVTVVKVIDSSTNKTVTQIPSEDMIDLAKALDKLQGLLVKQKA